jgi:hypothetical protein
MGVFTHFPKLPRVDRVHGKVAVAEAQQLFIKATCYWLSLLAVVGLVIRAVETQDPLSAMEVRVPAPHAEFAQREELSQLVESVHLLRPLLPLTVPLTLTPQMAEMAPRGGGQ